MVKSAEIKGNVKLDMPELNALRDAVIKKYSQHANIRVDLAEKKFNSNQENYDELIESIKAFSSALIGRKPLSNLIHFSKYEANKRSFRMAFINALYIYAYGISREEFRKQRNATIEKIEGYWECYYDKDGTLQKQFKENGEAFITTLALMIRGISVDRAEVKFFHPNGSGSGTVEIDGTNIFLWLRSKITNEPTVMFMNCGRPIDKFPSHIRVAAGFFLHVDSIASPKSAKCLMIYDEAKSNIDLDDKTFQKQYKSSVMLQATNGSKELDRIKSFFERGVNTTDTNIYEYRDVDKNEEIKNSQK